MVVSKSTPINRRAAKSNAQQQAQERAANLVAQGQTDNRIQQISQGLDPNAAQFRNPVNNPDNTVRQGDNPTFVRPTNSLGERGFENALEKNVDPRARLINKTRLGDIASSPLKKTMSPNTAPGTNPNTFSQANTPTSGTGAFINTNTPTTTASPNISQSAQRILDNVAKRKQQRLSANDPNFNKEKGIIEQNIKEYQDNLKNEAGTDDYKQKAFLTEGFKNDGTDQFDINLQNAFKSGGEAAALKVIQTEMASVGDNPDAINNRKEELMSELDRIKKFEAINNGTYQFEEDINTVNDLNIELEDAKKKMQEDSKKRQADAISSRLAGIEEFDTYNQEIQSQIDQMSSTMEANPDIAGIYQPIYNNLKAQQLSLIQERYQLENAAYDNTDYVDALENQQDQLLVDKNKTKDLVKRSSDLKIQAAKDVQAARNAELSVKKLIDEQQQIVKKEENIKQEVSNRRTANRFGIEADTNGLQWMQEEVEQGNRELQTMVKIATIENNSLVAQIGGEYYKNIESALIEYDAKNLEIDSTYNSEMLNISQIINQTEKEEADAAQERIAAYWEKKTKLDNDTASTISSYKNSLFAERIRVQDRSDKLVTEKFGQLMNIASVYGSSNPGAMRGIVNDLTKLGVDMSGFDVNAQTGDELSLIASANKASATTMAERAADSQLEWIGKYGDETGSIMQALIGSKEFSNPQMLANMNRLEMVAGLDDKNINKRVTFLDVARDGMEKPEREKLTASAVTYDKIDETIGLIEKYRNTGVWNTMIQQKLKWADLPKNSELLKIQSNLGFMVTQLTKEFFGANFTQSEMERAGMFLPDIKQGAPPEDLDGLLKNWKSFIELESKTALDNRFGSGGEINKIVDKDNLFDLLSGSGNYESSTNWDLLNSTGDYDSIGQQDEFGGIPGVNMSVETSEPSKNLTSYNEGKYNLPSVQQTAYTPFISSSVIVTGYGSKVWDAGVDVWAPKGTPIKAPAGGEVIAFENGYSNKTMKPDYRYAPGKGKGTFGNYVKIKHDDGYTAQYSHLDSLAVKNGDKISKGSFLAKIGNTGTTYGNTGVHLDFTLWDPKGRMLSAKEAAAYLGISSQTA